MTENKEIDAGLVISDRKVAYWHFLIRDPLPFISLLWIILTLVAAFIGPELLGNEAVKMNLKARNTPPGFLQNGWMGILGTDSLGRSMLARTIVATRNTVGIALAASVSAMVLGGIIGLFAGYVGRWPAKVIMQISDIIQSFPSILLAMIVLYILEPRAANLVIVLAFTRLPVYIRVARSEVLELRERLFVDAARVLGSSSLMILYRHIAPMAAPTVITYWTVDVAFVMLSESGLSFLGIGIQPPEITWGLMVAHGRNYLEIAWWQAFFPGLMIMLSTLSINILSSWVRRIIDPLQRWKFEVQK
jgi:peptide/nickel transport system permease protein